MVLLSSKWPKSTNPINTSKSLSQGPLLTLPSLSFRYKWLVSPLSYNAFLIPMVLAARSCGQGEVWTTILCLMFLMISLRSASTDLQFLVKQARE